MTTSPSVPRQRGIDAPTRLTPAIGGRQSARLFQVIAVTILVVGAVVGSFAAFGGDPAPSAAPAADFTAGEDIHAQEALMRAYARAKAEEAAAQEAEKARQLAEVATAAKPTQTSTQAAPPAAPAPDIPASCDVYSGNRALGCALMLEAGFGLDQMGCLEALWTKESNWRESAHNSSSGAHGIPQALPGSKMATFGADWETNPVTQIRWGLDYIKNRYGTPCGAWQFWQGHNWY